MLRKIVALVLLLTLFSAFATVQAQRRLPKPKNPRVEGDTLHWDAVAGARAYRVRWGKATATVVFTTEETTQNHFNLSGLSYNDTHFVKLKAISSDTAKKKNSRWTDIIVVVRPDPGHPPDPPPAAPELKKLPAPDNIRLLAENTVAWDAVAGADRYRVRLDPPNAARILKRVDSPLTQYTFDGLQAGLMYTVRVRAMGDEQRYELLGAWSESLPLRIDPPKS
ncbi:MAG: fibronectin type III domain-containing protein [Chloroflexi bacterium]|nr:fibronectin type III domain-containing protein [Chloroflexota bacterium]